MRRPSRVPTSSSPVALVCKRRSTGTVDCSGAGSFQASPGSVSTRTGAPNWVTTTASPALTATAVAASAAAPRTRPARAKRRAACGLEEGRVTSGLSYDSVGRVPRRRAQVEQRRVRSGNPVVHDDGVGFRDQRDEPGEAALEQEYITRRPGGIPIGDEARGVRRRRAGKLGGGGGGIRFQGGRILPRFGEGGMRQAALGGNARLGIDLRRLHGVVGVGRATR